MRSLLIRHAAGRQHLGQSPIHHLHLAKRPDHNVGWLQIAMNNPARVRVRHRLTDMLEDADELPTLCGSFLSIGQ